MPAHDWTRVSDGTFHDFHYSWVLEIKRAVKRWLPAGYIVMAEQHAGDLGAPDVLTLQTQTSELPTLDGVEGVATLTDTMPAVATRYDVERDTYTSRQRSLVVRHTSDHRIVAMIEVVSAGNKSSQNALESFLGKTVAAIQNGIHLLLVDVHAPGRRDPDGIHGAVLEAMNARPYTLDSTRPLMAIAYRSGAVLKAFVETFAVGDPLPTMPLFLTPTHYINVPLESAYMNAWADVPAPYQTELTAS